MGQIWDCSGKMVCSDPYMNLESNEKQIWFLIQVTSSLANVSMEVAGRQNNSSSIRELLLSWQDDPSV